MQFINTKHTCSLKTQNIQQDIQIKNNNYFYQFLKMFIYNYITFQQKSKNLNSK